ncbi:hypothetical protein [Actinosynnema sp. NPDC020468]|uniref:hypothetical protein n=1 Tax=Actinosynnema sp. NPDC020468 TaxID=3154488 RepID=UPI0033D8F4AE
MLVVRTLGVAAVVIALAAPAAWADQSGDQPQLSIGVDDGRTSAAPGDTLTYAVTLRNLGAEEVADLKVVLTLPTGLAYESADHDGAEGKGEVGWTVTLPAAGEAEFHVTASVTETPRDQLRLAATACARVGDDDPPLVCASHSDELPAGAAAEARRTTASTSWAYRLRWYLIGGGLAVLALAAFLLGRKRKAARDAAWRAMMEQRETQRV